MLKHSMLLFISIFMLVSCGVKGPLYYPVKPQNPVQTQEVK